MTAGFLDIRDGFRVSTGATLGYITRCCDHAPRRLAKFLQTAIPARNAASPGQGVGGVGASDGVGVVTAHGSDRDRGSIHEAEYEFHGKENVV